MNAWEGKNPNLTTYGKTQSLFRCICTNQVSGLPSWPLSPLGQIVCFALVHHNWLISCFELPFLPLVAPRGDLPHSGGYFVLQVAWKLALCKSKGLSCGVLGFLTELLIAQEGPRKTWNHFLGSSLDPSSPQSSTPAMPLFHWLPKLQQRFNPSPNSPFPTWTPGVSGALSNCSLPPAHQSSVGALRSAVPPAVLLCSHLAQAEVLARRLFVSFFSVHLQS
jgi:hypothetical protein